MNNDLLRNLILYLVSQLNDLDAPISKIRIVKLLYIIDLEHYRSYERTLTNLDWIYYDYGPYAHSINSTLTEMGYHLGEESVDTEQGHKAFKYKTDTFYDIGDSVNLATKLKINKIINHWHSIETDDLLDYVYTETEPMKEAVYNEPLDFSDVRRDIRVNRQSKHIKLSKEGSAKIQAMLKARKEKPKTKMTPARYDAEFFEAMRIMDEEDGLGRNLCLVTDDKLVVH